MGEGCPFLIKPDDERDSPDLCSLRYRRKEDNRGPPTLNGGISSGVSDGGGQEIRALGDNEETLGVSCRVE